MAVCRSIASWALTFWLFALGAPGSAQNEPGQWTGNLYAVEARHTRHGLDKVCALIDDDDNLVETIPNVHHVADFPVPLWYRNNPMCSYWHGGALYALVYGVKDKDADGNASQLWTMAKWEDNQWRHLGGLRTSEGAALTTIPCDYGRFIVVSSDKSAIGAGAPDPTPFHVISLPEAGKSLRLDRAIDHGHDELRGYMTDQGCFRLAFLSRTAVTDSHAVMVSPNTGLYWVFSLEKASLVKAGSIFKKVTPKMVAKGGFPDAVLCVNPEKGGTVLVAAQDESFFLTEKGDALAELNETLDKNPHISFEAAAEIYRERYIEIAARNPFIVWYRIHPESGRAERLCDPPEGGTFFRDGWKNDTFRPMADGSVRMGWSSRSLDEKVAKRQHNVGEKERASVEPGTESKGAEPSPWDHEGQAGGVPPPEGSGADGEADKGAGKGGATAG